MSIRHPLRASRRAAALLLVAGLATLAAACTRGSDETHNTVSSSTGSVAAAADTGGRASAVVMETGATPAIGPGIQVTRTDARSVDRSTDYKLTDDAWRRFNAAADSVAALMLRNAQVHQYLSANITDAGARDVDAGMKYLEANDSVRSAITRAGLTVKDYYRLGIATASASRFIDDPKAAPPTPTTRDNATFLRAHVTELQQLRELSRGKPTAPTATGAAPANR